MPNARAPAPLRWERLCLIACLVALAAISSYQHWGRTANINPPRSDYFGYYRISHNIAYGLQPVAQLPPHFMPGVYLFYGGIIKLGQGQYGAVVIANTLLYGVTAFIAYLVCRNVPPLYPLRLWPLVILCLNATKINYLKFVATETACAALAAGCVLGLVMYLKVERVGFLLGGAVCLGLAVFFRPAVISVGIGISCYFLWQGFRQRHTRLVRIPAALALAVLLVAIPNALKNYFLLEQFIPFTTSGGSGFLCGNNPLSDGTWCGGNFYAYLNAQAETDGIDLGTWGDDSRWDRYNYQLGLRFIRNNPLQACGLFLKKSLYFWAEGLARNIPAWEKGLHLVKIIFIFSGLIGLLRLRQHGPRLLGVSLLSFYLFHVIYLTQTRYKIPVDWLISIILVFGLAGYCAKTINWWHRRAVTSAVPEE